MVIHAHTQGNSFTTEGCVMLEEYRIKHEEWQHRNSFLMNELHKRGILTSPEHQIQKLINTPDEELLIESLLASLEQAPSERDLISYISMIGGNTLYDPSKLISIFNTTSNRLIRSAIVHTLTQSRPIGIKEWFVYMLSDPNADAESRYAIAGLIYHAENPRQYIPLLLEHFDDLRGSALNSLDHIGTAAELEFLKSKRGILYGWPENVSNKYQKFLEKVIVKLARKAAQVSTKINP
jgi:hypothetical protein